MIGRLAAAFDAVPGWIYAGIIVALLAMFGASSVASRLQLSAAQVAMAGAKQALAQEREWLAREAQEASDKARVAEGDLRDALDAQEGKDAQARKTIEGLQADLRQRSRAGGGGGMRDNFAAACPAGEPAGAAVAAAPGGAGNPPEAGRALSERLENLLLQLAADADQINVAYASCRADALSTRERLKELPTPATVPP